MVNYLGELQRLGATEKIDEERRVPRWLRILLPANGHASVTSVHTP